MPDLPFHRRNTDVIDKPPPETIAAAIDQKQPSAGPQDTVHLRHGPILIEDDGDKIVIQPAEIRPRGAGGLARLPWHADSQPVADAQAERRPDVVRQGAGDT